MPNLQDVSLDDLLKVIQQRLPGLDLSKVVADNSEASHPYLPDPAVTPPAKRARVEPSPAPSVAQNVMDDDASATQPATDSQLLASGLLLSGSPFIQVDDSQDPGTCLTSKRLQSMMVGRKKRKITKF